MPTITHTFTITSADIHILLDALQRHSIALDEDPTDDPSLIYEGIYPADHLLRNRAAYREAVDSLNQTIYELRGATDDDGIVTLTVEG